MADPPKTSASPFSFPSATSAATGGGSLFGGVGSSSGASTLFGGAKNGSGNNIFGNASSTSAPATSSSIFGSAANSTSTPSLFNTGATGSAPGGSGFSFANVGGQNKAATPGGGNSIPSAFSAFSTPNKTSDITATSNTPQSLFNVGGSTTGKPGNLFGGIGSTTSTSAPAAGTTTPVSKAGGLFSLGSNLSTTPAGPPPASNAGNSAPSLFSSSKPQQPFNMMSGSAGSQNAFQAAAAPTTSSSTSSIFGNAGALTSNSVFAQKDQSSSAAPASGLFNTAKPSAPSALFGNLGASTGTAPLSFMPPSSTSAQQSKAGEGQSSQATSGLFPGVDRPKPAVNTTSQPATSALFPDAGAKTSTSTSQSPFFPRGPAQSPSTAAAGTSAPAASPFTLGASTSASASSSTPTFSVKPAAASPSNIPGQADKGKGAEATTAPGSSAAGTSSTTTTSSTTKPFFGLAPPANTMVPTTQSSTQPAGPAAAPDTTKAASATASTAGPKPTPESRLKNKSMDEILTRWASDLAKYQKEFQTQAEKVAEWDRLLVDNSEKIQKLYGSTLEAERATIEVERQLSAVENDQAELEYWLDHYERQVDELMANQVGQSESLQGPDQERERTYKLAEKLSDRLDEMNKDLTGMIEEINASSDTLAKTKKADEPLEQIVRILNGHLQQLQLIDQGTATLQAKISETKKNTRALGRLTNIDGPGNDSVDDFYKSYMGRR